MKKRYVLLIALAFISIIPLSWAMWHVIDPCGARMFRVSRFPTPDAILALGELGDPRAYDTIVSILRDDRVDVSLRAAAAEALGELGDRRAVVPLCVIVKDSDREDTLRQAAASALGKLGNPVAVGALKGLADDRTVDEAVRKSAADALRKIGGDRPVAALLRILATEKDEAIRCEAAYALGEIGDPEAVEPLIAVFETGNSEALRAEAARALGKLGDRRAVASLLQALKHPKSGWKDREAAARILDALHAAPTSGPDYAWYVVATYRSYSFDDLGADAVEPLIAALLEKEKEIWSREQAAYALGRIGDSKAVEPLITVLGDKTAPPMLRSKAAKALAKLADPRAVEPLITALADAKIREDVAQALGCLGDARAVEPLIAVSEDKDQFVAEAAAEALEKLGDLRAVEPLIAMLKHKGRYAAEAAAQALGELGDRRAVEPLIATLVEPRCIENNDEAESDSEPVRIRMSTDDRSVAEAAAKALGRLGDRRAVEPLIAVVKDRGSSARGAAALALGELKDPRATGPLFEAIGELDGEARRALCRLGDSADVEIVLAMTRHSSPDAQLATICLLTMVDDPRVLDPLLDVFKDESHAHIEFKSMVVWRSGRLRPTVSPSSRIPRIVEALIPILKSYYDGSGTTPLSCTIPNPSSSPWPTRTTRAPSTRSSRPSTVPAPPMLGSPRPPPWHDSATRRRSNPSLSLPAEQATGRRSATRRRRH